MYSHQIRTINVTTGIVTSFTASTTTHPYCLRFDESGNLFASLRSQYQLARFQFGTTTATIGATTDHKIDCFDQHGLTCTCFTSECGETFIERNTDVLNDAEILN
jgi:hypothetical protein